MTKQRNPEVDRILLYLTKLMTEESDKHADLVDSLSEVAGKTKEYQDIMLVLKQIYDTKISLLDKIYKEIINI